MNYQQVTRATKQKFSNNFSTVRLYVIISSNLSRKPALETLEDVIQGGADAVQLREKIMPDSEFLVMAKEFKRITAQSRTLFIVNDRAEIAKEWMQTGCIWPIRHKHSHRT